MQSVQAKDLAQLDEILKEIDKGTTVDCDLLREHLQSARTSLIGSMPAEYALSLNMAADALHCVSDQTMRTCIQDFIQGRWGKQYMPEKKTLDRARKDAREGKSPGTQAGEFVREEMDHIREGKHGARSAKQAIAIGLSKARRAGVKLAPPKAAKSSPKTRAKAEHDVEAGRTRRKPSAKRSRATLAALKREGRQAASPKALSRHSRQATRTRTKARNK
jgi:hypothetical protein